MDSRLEQVLLTTYGEVVGAAMSGALRLMGRSCRLHTSGPQPPPDRGAIVCLWHEHVLLFFAHTPYLRGRWLSLLHPAPYMKPWERVARSFNWRVAVGATGHGGRRAAEEAVELLRQGYSMMVALDGPAGPPHVLRKGALHMACQAGVPLVPLRFRCSLGVRLPSWDGKWLPLPGATRRRVEARSARRESPWPPPHRGPAEGVRKARWPARASSSRARSPRAPG
jgi:lysophospholipid acyltransferase (LPLAT)-like uncharacterized protein